jgi:hypothetical protein
MNESNTLLTMLGQRGSFRYVIDQDPDVVEACVSRAGPGMIEIQDRRDGCIAQIWSKQFVSAEPTLERPSTALSTLVAIAQRRT